MCRRGGLLRYPSSADDGFCELLRSTDTGLCELFRCALTLAAHKGHIDIVELLLRFAANTDQARTYDGATPLMLAARKGCEIGCRAIPVYSWSLWYLFRLLLHCEICRASAMEPSPKRSHEAADPSDHEQEDTIASC